MKPRKQRAEQFGKEELGFIIASLFGWRMKDGTRRYKRAFLDQKHMHDRGLWQVLFAGLALSPELKDTWSFLILHKAEALREMWRKLRGVDLDSLGIEQVTNNVDRAYFRRQQSRARLGIVAESEVDVLVQLGLTQGTGFVALRQVQYFKDPGRVSLAFKSASLLMMTMSHRNKAHTARSRKFLKEPTIQLANGTIDDRTFVWCAARKSEWSKGLNAS